MDPTSSVVFQDGSTKDVCFVPTSILAKEKASFHQVESSKGEASVNNASRTASRSSSVRKAREKAQEIFDQVSPDSAVLYCKSFRKFEEQRKAIQLQKEDITLNGENLKPDQCVWVETTEEATLEEAKNQILEMGFHPHHLAREFDNGKSWKNHIVVSFSDSETADKFLRESKNTSAGVKFRSKRRRIGNGVSMPSFQPLNQVKSSLEKESEVHILENLSEEGTKVLLPGPLVVDSRKVLQLRPRIQVEDEDILLKFQDAVQIVRGKDSLFVLFDDLNRASEFHGKVHSVNGERLTSHLMKIPKGGGVMNPIEDSIKNCFLQSNISPSAFFSGEEYLVEMIVWADAKYSGGHEKSFLKVSLVSPIFPNFVSEISRWIDVAGHESEFLRKEISERILDDLAWATQNKLSFETIQFTIKVVYFDRRNQRR